MVSLKRTLFEMGDVDEQLPQPPQAPTISSQAPANDTIDLPAQDDESNSAQPAQYAKPRLAMLNQVVED